MAEALSTPDSIPLHYASLGIIIAMRDGTTGTTGTTGSFQISPENNYLPSKTLEIWNMRPSNNVSSGNAGLLTTHIPEDEATLFNWAMVQQQQAQQAQWDSTQTSPLWNAPQTQLSSLPLDFSLSQYAISGTTQQPQLLNNFELASSPDSYSLCFPTTHSPATPSFMAQYYNTLPHPLPDTTVPLSLYNQPALSKSTLPQYPPPAAPHHPNNAALDIDEDPNKLDEDGEEDGDWEPDLGAHPLHDDLLCLLKLQQRSHQATDPHQGDLYIEELDDRLAYTRARLDLRTDDHPNDPIIRQRIRHAVLILEAVLAAHRGGRRRTLKGLVNTGATSVSQPAVTQARGGQAVVQTTMGQSDVWGPGMGRHLAWLPPPPLTSLPIPIRSASSTPTLGPIRRSKRDSPRSSGSGEGHPKKTRKNYEKDITAILMNFWFATQGRLPRADEKDRLSAETGLSIDQLATWFQNARRRRVGALKHFNDLRRAGEVWDWLSYDAWVKRNKENKRGVGVGASTKRNRRSYG
ncbi:hypothetical protein BC938DRAFT_479668 [Jimgerdemannia flammicorona]|uniref:Homeobox domain-containing protein n=1 Tax=Jimgerdemannia flammicorona TaxID=994334 RepID=A0A433QXN4_9FUNG|nr:hypothetical protein BC938DRAFT_479668 [Jimgerdemannia flammicorona]